MPGAAKALQPKRWRCCSAPERMQENRRVFFAIWPDETALEKLSALAQAGGKLCGGRAMRPDSLHMTLVFIGAASPGQLECLKEAAAGVNAAPFEMVIDRLGWWPHNRILWAGCHAVPSGERRLYDGLVQSIVAKGFQPDARPHVPHVTLVRHGHGVSLPDLQTPIRWWVREFSLVESFLQPSGARYRVLERWSLRSECQ